MRHGGYGWHPDTDDSRDLLFVDGVEVEHLPANVDLAAKMPPVYDQGQLGSCTANAIAAALEYQEHAQKERTGTPSRLFIYYGEREIEGTISQDAGAMIRDGMKVVAKLGAPPETLWPYKIGRFTEKPPAKAYAAALRHEVVVYSRVMQTAAAIKGALAAGFPVVFGFTVYDSFESDQVAQTGDAPMPGPNDQPVGGHAVVAVGYDDTTGRWRCRNSWGTGWGAAGYFTLPYPYLTGSLASDFWTIKKVS